jgi:uncharacterized phage protein (TIGR02218 family)
MGNARVTQAGLKVLLIPASGARVTQAGLKVLLRDSTADTGVSAAMKAHLSMSVTTLCTLLKLTATDATVLRYCNNSRAVTYNAESYTPIPLTPTELRMTSSLNPGDAELLLPYTPGLTEADLRNGKWNHARVEVLVVNYEDPSMGFARRAVGYLGEINVGNQRLKPEFRSLTALAGQEVGDNYSPVCRVVALGDAAVAGYDAKRVFTVNLGPAKADGYFANGKATWTAGANSGLVMEVKNNWGNQIELFLPMPQPVQAGDTITLVAGCDRRRETCRSTFSNVVNFRGEPDLPGRDRLFKIPERPDD